MYKLIKVAKFAMLYCIFFIISINIAFTEQKVTDQLSKSQTKDYNNPNELISLNPDGTLSFTSRGIISISKKDRLTAIKEVSKRNQQIKNNNFPNETQGIFREYKECSNKSSYDKYCKRRMFGGMCCTDVDKGTFVDDCDGKWKSCASGW